MGVMRAVIMDRRPACMQQLRDKLELDPVRPRHLLTEAGVGYRLVLEE